MVTVMLWPHQTLTMANHPTAVMGSTWCDHPEAVWLHPLPCDVHGPQPNGDFCGYFHFLRLPVGSSLQHEIPFPFLRLKWNFKQRSEVLITAGLCLWVIIPINYLGYACRLSCQVVIILFLSCHRNEMPLCPLPPPTPPPVLRPSLSLPMWPSPNWQQFIGFYPL